MAQDTLVRFSEEIVRGAEGKREQLIKELEKNRGELLKVRKEELEKEYEKYVKDECGKIKNKNGVFLSELRRRMRYEVISLRREMFDEVFGEVVRNLIRYTETEEYEKRLKDRLLKAVREIGSGKTLCYARECDMECLKEAAAGENISFAEEKHIIIGGFILENAERRLILDCTLDAEIEKKKELFFIESGLNID